MVMTELGSCPELFRHRFISKDSGSPVVPRGDQRLESGMEARTDDSALCTCSLPDNRTTLWLPAMRVLSTQGHVSFVLIVQSSHDLAR